MSTCVNYCTTDPLGSYEIIECANDPVGGLSSVVILECGHSITEADAADPADFAAAITAALNASPPQATLIERCSLTIDAASPVTTESLVPCETPQLVTYDRKGIYKNPNVTPTNIGFHDRLFDGRKFGGMIVFECATLEDATQYVTWVNDPVKFTGSRIVPEKNTEFQRFEGEFVWRSKHNPMRYVAPTGIFN